MPRTKMMKRKSSMKVKAKSLKRMTSTSVESLASSASSTGEQASDLNALLSDVYQSPYHFQLAVETFYEKKVAVFTKRYEFKVDYVKNTISQILKSYPESLLNSKLDTHCNEKVFQDQNKDPTTKSGRSTRQSRLQKEQRAMEEPSDFKKPRTPRRTSRKRSLSVPAPAPPPQFKTPLNNTRQQMAMIKTITPKVSSTPVSVMRRPQHGEVAFSTSGSPLLIAAVSREDIPTVSVPMMDGRVFSILPDPGLPPPDLPDFDEDTKKYLRTLRDHLAMLSSP